MNYENKEYKNVKKKEVIVIWLLVILTSMLGITIAILHLFLNLLFLAIITAIYVSILSILVIIGTTLTLKVQEYEKQKYYI